MVSPIDPNKRHDSLIKSSLSLPPIGSIATESLSFIQQALALLNPLQKAEWANSRNERGMTPLAIAIEAHTSSTNKMDVIVFLVNECGADPNIGDNDNWTPVYRASTGTRSDALLFLLNHKANPNFQNKDGSTPLHRIVDRGNQEDLLALINSGADVNIMNCIGTPLAYAAKNGNTQIAAILLDAKADPNLVNDPLGLSPLEQAINNHKEEMIQLLLAQGGQKLIPLDSHAHTPISRLAYGDDKRAILQSFENDEKDKYERSVAHYCAALGKEGHLLEMHNKGSLDRPDNKGRTPLHYAIMKGQNSVVEYLTSNEEQCTLTSRDAQGYAPLMWACQYNQKDIARHLLEKAQEKGELKTVLDISDNFGWKAIHKAAQVGNVDIMRMLVEEYHVDHTQQTANGRTPLDLATTANERLAVEYLNRLAHPLTDLINKA